jgi:transposase
MRGQRRVPPSSWISGSRVARAGDSYQKASSDGSAIWRASRRNHGQALPRGWVVERAFSWSGGNRRLSQDDEELPYAEEAWIDLAMIRLMLARLTR